MKTSLDQIMANMDQIIADAPDEPVPIEATALASRDVAYSTQLPKRYRLQWDRPTDDAWIGTFAKLTASVKSGGIIALIGKRGTGKTRFAAEVMRNYSPEKSYYTTAMGLFLRIRASFGVKGGESEEQIVKELSQSSLLILDEVQERGNTAWEDRLLTHILDRRYGAMKPTILIANLEADELTQCLGDSINSRINETGGIITLTGRSFRE